MQAKEKPGQQNGSRVIDVILFIAALIILFGSLKGRDYRETVAAFCIPMVMSMCFGVLLDGFVYFFCNSCFACMSVYWLSVLDNRLSKSLSVLLLVSIPLNMIGYINYYFYEPPFLYVFLFRIWFVAALVTIWRGGFKCFISFLGYLHSSRCFFAHGQR